MVDARWKKDAPGAFVVSGIGFDVPRVVLSCHGASSEPLTLDEARDVLRELRRAIKAAEAIVVARDRQGRT